MIDQLHLPLARSLKLALENTASEQALNKGMITLLLYFFHLILAFFLVPVMKYLNPQMKALENMAWQKGLNNGMIMLLLYFFHLVLAFLLVPVAKDTNLQMKEYQILLYHFTLVIHIFLVPAYKDVLTKMLPAVLMTEMPQHPFFYNNLIVYFFPLDLYLFLVLVI